MFAIYVKNYRDAGGEVITTENKLLQIPFMEYNKELGQDITVGYDAGIINPTVKTECGSAGSFEFSMESESPYFNSFLIMKTIIRIEYDGETIFRGRVLNLDDQMWGTRSVHCEGDLAFLLDVQYPGTVDSKRTKQKIGSYITNLMGYYNDNIRDSDKKIVIGHIPGSYPHHDEDFHYNSEQEIGEETKKHGSSSWQSVGDALNSLKSNYGGWFRTRYESGITYLDWLNWYFNPKINDQVLSITDNMINISSTVELSDIFTVVIPVGQKTTTKSSKDSKDTSLYIEGYMTDVHGNNKYIRVPDLIKLYSKSQLDSGYHTYEDYANAIDDYGWIYKTVSFSNANTQAKLWSYAVDWIKENYIGKNRQFTITAIDLHSMGYSCDKITVGDRVTVRLPYDSDTERRIFTVLSITYDLYNPENNSYTIGVPTDNKSSKEYGTKNNTKTTKSSTPVSKDPGKNDKGFEWDWEENQWDIATGLADFMRHAGLITDEGAAYLLDHLNDADDERSQGFRVLVNGTTGADFVYRSISHFLIDSSTGVVQQMKGFFGFDEPTGDVDPGFDFSLTGDFTNEMTNVQYDAKHSRWNAKETATLTHADGGERTYNFGVGIDGTTGYIYAKKLVLIDNDEPFEITNKLVVLGGSVDSLDDNLKGLAAYANELDKSITVVASDVFQVGATMSDQYLELNKGLLDLDKTVTNLSSDVTNIGQTMDTSLSDMTLRLAEMGKTVTNITSDVVNIGQQISDVGAQVTQELASMNITVTNLTSDVTQIGDGLTQAQADVASNGDKILAINKDVAVINAAVTILGGDYPVDPETGKAYTRTKYIQKINADLKAMFSDLSGYTFNDENGNEYQVNIPKFDSVVRVDNLVADNLAASKVYADEVAANTLAAAKVYADEITANKITADRVKSIIGEYNFIQADSISSTQIQVSRAIWSQAGIATPGTVTGNKIMGHDLVIGSGSEYDEQFSVKQFIRNIQIVPSGINGEYLLQYNRYSDGTAWVTASTFSVAASVILTGAWDSAASGRASYYVNSKLMTTIRGYWSGGKFYIYSSDQSDGDTTHYLTRTDISSVVAADSVNNNSAKNVTANVKVYYVSPYDTSGTAKDTGKTGLTVTVNAGSVYDKGWKAAYDEVDYPTSQNTTASFSVTFPGSVVGSDYPKTYTLKDILIATSSASGSIGLYQGAMQVAGWPVKLSNGGWVVDSTSSTGYRLYYYINANSDKTSWVARSSITGGDVFTAGKNSVGFKSDTPTYKNAPPNTSTVNTLTYTLTNNKTLATAFQLTTDGWVMDETKIGETTYAKGHCICYIMNTTASKQIARRIISGATPYNTGWKAAAAKVKVNASTTSTGKVTVPSSTVGSTSDLSITLTPNREFTTTESSSKSGYLEAKYGSTVFSKLQIVVSGSGWLTTVNETSYPKGIYYARVMASGTKCMSVLRITGNVPYGDGYDAGVAAENFGTVSWITDENGTKVTTGTSNSTDHVWLTVPLKKKTGTSKTWKFYLSFDGWSSGTNKARLRLTNASGPIYATKSVAIPEPTDFYTTAPNGQSYGGKSNNSSGYYISGSGSGATVWIIVKGTWTCGGYTYNGINYLAAAPKAVYAKGWNDFRKKCEAEEVYKLINGNYVKYTRYSIPAAI